MSMRAERSPHGRNARGGQADQPKRKVSVKKLWPQIRALVAPRMGLLFVGMALHGHQPCGRPGFALYRKASVGYGAFASPPAA